jgi:hypothetical protein
MAVEFGKHFFGDPKFTVEECKEKDMNYAAPLFVEVRLINKETGEIIISAGKDDDKADSLRDEMDIVWEMLYEDEQAEVRSVAAQIGDKKNEQ